MVLTKNRTTILVQASLIMAIGIMFNLLRQDLLITGLPLIRISFGEPFFFINAIMFGPFYGALTGALSDIITIIIKPSALAYNPILTITAALKYIIAAYLYIYFKRTELKEIYKMLATIALTMLIMLPINTLVLMLVFIGDPSVTKYVTLLIPRLITNVIVTGYNCFITISLLKLIPYKHLYTK